MRHIVMMRVPVILLLSALCLLLPMALVPALHHADAAAPTHAAPFACHGWQVVNAPDPGTTGYLNGVAAISSTDSWAVGGSINSGLGQTLVEQWNGTSWSVVPSPNSGNTPDILTAISVRASTDIWALGDVGATSTAPLIEHWNGTEWSIVSSPPVNSQTTILATVSAISQTNAWAVGWYDDPTTQLGTTLIEHWNGKAWKIVQSPNVTGNNSYLEGVTALSASDIIAVGYDNNPINPDVTNQTLVEQWNGTAWSIVPSPSPGTDVNYLAGVTGRAKTGQAWAVGYSEGGSDNGPQTLIEQWNGSSWTVVNSPSPGSIGNWLASVSAASVKNIWAVGYQSNYGVEPTLIEHWNGTTWQVVSSPSPGGINKLSSVAVVPGKAMAWTVGTDWNSEGGDAQPLIEGHC